MADQYSTNGTGSANDLTPAQRLMERHTGDDDHTHNVTVEDVVDEDDVQHPPPSGIPSTTQAANRDPASLSDKAAGKNPEAAPAPAPTKPAFDTTSEELFPALGAPTSRAAAAPTPWSRKPPAVASNRAANGLANGHAAQSNTSTRTSAPPSGMATPASTAHPHRGAFPQMSLPGRHTERVQFAPSQLTPRNQLKKPVNDVLREINKRSKARVEMSTGPGGVIIFEGIGPVDAVRQALKEVAKELGSKVSRHHPGHGTRTDLTAAIGQSPCPAFRATTYHWPPRSQHPIDRQAHRR